jgi:hypothetical protein
MFEDIFYDEEKLFQCCVRVDCVFERREAEHWYQLFARTQKWARNMSMGTIDVIDPDIKIITAIAVINPCSMARLSTTSINPSLKKPSKNDMSPDYIFN